MKKIISVVVSLMLAATLCACTNGNDSTNSGSDYGNNISNNSSDPFEMGKVSGNKYSNEFFGIGCTLDSQWTFKTDEEIKEANNITIDMLDDEIKSQLENAAIVYDMMATSESGSSININIESIGVSGVLTTVESYLSSQTDPLKAALEQVGLSDAVIENKTYDFAGSSEKGLYIHTSINQVTFEEAIIVLKRGTHFANITVATTSGDLNSILASFYAI